MTRYKISTPATDLGIYHAGSADEALDMLAREAGYRDHAHACAETGPWSGTVTEIDCIDPDWLTTARSNEGPDSTLEDWIARAINASEVEVDEDGRVSADGRWLDQARIDEICARVDAGV